MPARISSRRLVERRAELEALERALERAGEGDPTVTLVIGEAGIGKSRLLREAELHARAQGMAVLRGECLRLDGGELPFAPLAALLRDAPQAELDAALGRARAGGAGGARARVPAPGLGAAGRRRLGAGPLRPGAGVRGDRDGVRRASGARRRCCVVLEDVHWVDRSTREFVRFLVRGLRRERLAVAISFRTGELGSADPVREMLADLQYHERVTLVELAPLGREGISAQLEGILGRPPEPSLAAELHERCGGNPLFAEELLSAHRDPGRREAPRAAGRRPARAAAAGPRAGPAAAALRGGDRAPGAGGAARRRVRAPASPSCRPRCATRSTTTCSSTTASATPSPSATTSCARRSTTTCCRASGRRCTARWRARSATRARRRSWRCTGARRASATGRCGPRSRPASRPRTRAPSTRRCGTCAPRSSCGPRREIRASGSIASSCSATSPTSRATRASTRRPWRGASRRWRRSTARRTPHGRRASSSGSGACGRSRTTAA